MTKGLEKQFKSEHPMICSIRKQDQTLTNLSIQFYLLKIFLYFFQFK